MRKAAVQTLTWPQKPSYLRFAPMHLFMKQKTVDVAYAKPSEIMVGSNVDSAIDSIEQTVSEIQEAFNDMSYDCTIKFNPTTGEVTSNKDNVTLSVTGGFTFIRGNDINKMILIRIDGHGCMWDSNIGNSPFTITDYQLVGNNSTVDASFSERRFIVFDKYTRTIKRISDTKQTVADDEGQVVVHVIVQGPELVNISSTMQNGSDVNPSYYEITDPQVGGFRCYKSNEHNFTVYNTSTGAALGLTYKGNTSNFSYEVTGHEPYVFFSCRDVTKAQAPEIFSRI